MSTLFEIPSRTCDACGHPIIDGEHNPNADDPSCERCDELGPDAPCASEPDEEERSTFFAWDDWSGAYPVTVRGDRWLVDAETLTRMVVNSRSTADPMALRNIVGDEAAEETAAAINAIPPDAAGLYDVTEWLGEPMESDAEGNVIG